MKKNYRKKRVTLLEEVDYVQIESHFFDTSRIVVRHGLEFGRKFEQNNLNQDQNIRKLLEFKV
jgi:hypothetical protein